MISPISSLQPQAVAAPTVTNQVPPQPQATSKAAPTSSAAAHSAPKDTVTISSAGHAMLQEMTETPAQTQREAGKGDRQAIRLLAKEAAEHQQ